MNDAAAPLMLEGELDADELPEGEVPVAVDAVPVPEPMDMDMDIDIDMEVDVVDIVGAEAVVCAPTEKSPLVA